MTKAKKKDKFPLSQQESQTVKLNMSFEDAIKKIASDGNAKALKNQQAKKI